MSTNDGDSNETVPVFRDEMLGSSAPPDAPRAVAVTYDPARTRETFAASLPASSSACSPPFIIARFALFWIHPDRAAILNDLFALIFGPVVALVGTATGFYFGPQSANRS